MKKDVGVTADHGYDYIIPQMRTVFFAAGPAILPEKYIEPFQNIEIYNLIAGDFFIFFSLVNESR